LIEKAQENTICAPPPEILGSTGWVFV